MKDKLYYTPVNFREVILLPSSLLWMREKTDVCVVSVQKKKNGMPWVLEAPVKLPGGITGMIGADAVGRGIVVTGKANVTAENVQISVCGREEMQCGPNCTLTVDGKECEITKTVAL